MILQSIHLIIHQDIGQILSEIEGRMDHPSLTKELAQEIETLWRDTAIQVASSSKIHKQPPWNLYCWYKVCLLSYFIIDTMVFMVSEWSISVINFNGYCRKHMPGAMSSKYQIAPLISWRICKDCLMQIIFQLRYLIFFLHIVSMSRECYVHSVCIIRISEQVLNPSTSTNCIYKISIP